MASILRTWKTPSCDKLKSATPQWPSLSTSASSSLRSLQIKHVHNTLVTTLLSSTALKLNQSVRAITIHNVTNSFRAQKTILMTTDTPHHMQQICSRRSASSENWVYTWSTIHEYRRQSWWNIYWMIHKKNYFILLHCLYIDCRLCEQNNHDYDLKYF
jgi:hypothetical protein